MILRFEAAPFASDPMGEGDMRDISRGVAFVAAALFFGIGASAQKGSAVSSAPELPRWDVDASLGGFRMDHLAIDRDQRAANPDRETFNPWTSAVYGFD